MKYLFLLLTFTLTALSAEKGNILLVLTNHSKLGDTGEKTGFYLSEAAHPYKVFSEKGYGVTLASPKGSFAPIDPKSMDLEDPANKKFWGKYSNMDESKPGVPVTKPLADADPSKFVAIFFAGGHGAVWDFPNDKNIQRLTSEIYTSGGAVGAVCHGPAALVNVKLPDGTHLISGKETAVFTDAEEEAVKLTETVPFLLEATFLENGAKVILGKNFTENAVRDGLLVTGQNPQSATKTGELLVEAIETAE